MSIFTKDYNLVNMIFKDGKECRIINIVIDQIKKQGTNKPLIEQTYLAKILNCDKKTIQRKLNTLEEEEWITRKRVKNTKGYFTTQISINDKFKWLLKEIDKLEDKSNVNKRIKQKVINSVIPNLEGGLSVDNVNF